MSPEKAEEKQAPVIAVSCREAVLVLPGSAGLELRKAGAMRVSTLGRWCFSQIKTEETAVPASG